MSLVDTMRAMRSRRSQKAARFTLLYAPQEERQITVGHLEFDGKMWTFRYDDEYKQHSDLRPIEGFDELEKVYHSSVLFPFFAVRIPDPGRDDVKRRLEEDRVRHPEPADLLRIFGRRVVSSPAFELVPA
jgi:HipA-like protein